MEPGNGRTLLIDRGFEFSIAATQNLKTNAGGANDPFMAQGLGAAANSVAAVPASADGGSGGRGGGSQGSVTDTVMRLSLAAAKGAATAAAVGAVGAAVAATAPMTFLLGSSFLFGLAIGNAVANRDKIGALGSRIWNGTASLDDWETVTETGAGLVAGGVFAKTGAKVVASKVGQWVAKRAAAKAAQLVAGEAGGAGKLRVCFPAGTKVSTPEGDNPIEELREGDEVFAFDFDTGDVVARKIKATFQRESNQLVQLTVDGKLIEATQSHPFWVLGHGWVEAADLKIGMGLSGLDGEPRTITDIGGRSGPVAVYNLEVDGEHNYFIGEDPVLVHNQNVVDTDFNRATNVALEWLRAQGIDTSKVVGPNAARFGPDKGLPNGVRFEGGGYYRIEYDTRSGAHINVGIRKADGPHIKFQGNQKTVNKLIQRLFRC